MLQDSGLAFGIERDACTTIILQPSWDLSLWIILTRSAASLPHFSHRVGCDGSLLCFACSDRAGYLFVQEARDDQGSTSRSRGVSDSKRSRNTAISASPWRLARSLSRAS